MKNPLKLSRTAKVPMSSEVKALKQELKAKDKLLREQEKDLEEYDEAFAESNVLIAQQGIIIRRLSKLIDNLDNKLFLTTEQEIVEELIAGGFDEDLAKELLEDVKRSNQPKATNARNTN